MPKNPLYLMMAGVLAGSLTSSVAQATNPGALSGAALTAPALPDASISLVRVIGALLLVIGIFLGGAWLVRNWQRVVNKGRPAARLKILESRSLGGRHWVHVVGYDRERMLVATSPSGVNLLSHLPAGTDETTVDGPPAPPSFSQALNQVLKGK